MPLPPLNAQRKDNEQHRSVIRTTPNGVEAVEWYLVNTSDIRKALTAPGLPEEDDPLDPVTYPRVLCHSIGVEDKMGGDDETTSRCGWSWVKVEYATPGAGSFTKPNLYPGQKWTEFQQGEKSETLWFSLPDPSIPLPPPPINNGEGYSREVGLITLIVNRCWELDHQPDFARYNTLAKDRAFNDDAITLPKLFGAGVEWTVPAERAQYKGCDPQVQGKVLVVRHFLQVGLQPFYSWPFVDPATGKATGGSGTARVYATESFADLW